MRTWFKSLAIAVLGLVGPASTAIVAPQLVPIQVAYAAKVCDGTGDGYQVTDPNVGSAAGTIGCWVNDSAMVDDASFVNYGTGNARGLMVNELTGGAMYTQLFQGGASSGGGSQSLSEGAWHSIIVTWTGTTLKTYVDATDGVADKTETATAPVAQNSTDDFKICQPIASDPWGGPETSTKWAHCFFANAVLDTTEIAAIADKSTCPTSIATHSANIKIFLKGTSGVAVTDSSTNAFSVTTNGNPTDDAGPGSLPCDSAASSNLPYLQAAGED